MKLHKVSALVLLLGSGLALGDDCAPPEAPALPEGATSTMEQMLEGQKAVKTFQAANLDYMKCLEPGIEAAKTDAEAAIEKGAGEDEAKAKYLAAQDAYNAAVSAEEEVAGKFNQAVRDYKAANPN